MNGGENKTPLALMEQVIMVFVFALAAALCVQVFVYARTVSVSMEERDHAMVVSQSLAETAKDCTGNIEAMKQCLGGYEQEKELLFFYDDTWRLVKDSEGACYQAKFSILGKDEFCGNGKVQVLSVEDEAEIFSLQIAWQE